MSVIRFQLDSGGTGTVNGTILTIDGQTFQEQTPANVAARLAILEHNMAHVLSLIRIENVTDEPGSVGPAA